jgi:hypothetical protein
MFSLVDTYLSAVNARSESQDSDEHLKVKKLEEGWTA